ncbi:MAG: hypothetical protein QOF11_183 [Chloroflexota bacterium]|nr:hypothetical protein [Chloroflexota bacterium]
MSHSPSRAEGPPTPAPTASKDPAGEPVEGGPGAIPQHGAIGAVESDEVAVSVGAIAAARARRVSVRVGAIGAVAARKVRVSQGVVGAVAAREARFKQTVVRSVIARDVHFGPGSGAAVVIAARVDGDARILLDWRGGLAAGAVLGFAWMVLRRLR